jgi:Fe2+ transport system protein B
MLFTYYHIYDIKLTGGDNMMTLKKLEKLKKEVINLEKEAGHKHTKTNQYYNKKIETIKKYLDELEEIKTDYDNKNITYMNKIMNTNRVMEKILTEQKYFQIEILEEKNMLRNEISRTS